MKTKNIFKTLALALLMPTMLLTTACSSDDNDIVNIENPANIQKGYPFPVTVNVSRQGDEPATRASYNESTRKLEFSTGDKLFVTGSHAVAGQFAGKLDYDAVSGKFSGTVTTQNDGYTGTIDGLMASAFAFLLPDGYESYGFFSVGSGYNPMISFDFTKAFALTKADAVEQFSLEYASSYSSGFALAPMNAIASFAISGLTANKEVAVSFNTYGAGVISRNVTTSAEGVATFAVGVSQGSKLENCTLTVDGNNIAMPTKTTVAGHIYKIMRTPGVLNGQFSVSSTKKVYFSKGNLQYDGTNWKFAASQWEVLGANGTGANGTATNYPMDLFTWGNIDSPTYNGTTYYTENADLSGITDWGSRMGSGWYTLSKDEWLYLFGMESNNTDKSGHARYRKYFRAKVNGVSGIVVLPDDLSGISDIPAESSRGTASTFNGKTYTTDAWSAMESAGCVFLPAAGFRLNGTSVMNVGSSGFYWPSTAYDADKAYTVGFDSDNVFPANNFNRNIGFSVRLVREVPTN